MSQVELPRHYEGSAAQSPSINSTLLGERMVLTPKAATRLIAGLAICAVALVAAVVVLATEVESGSSSSSSSSTAGAPAGTSNLVAVPDGAHNSYFHCGKLQLGIENHFSRVDLHKLSTNLNSLCTDAKVLNVTVTEANCQKAASFIMRLNSEAHFPSACKDLVDRNVLTTPPTTAGALKNSREMDTKAVHGFCNDFGCYGAALGTAAACATVEDGISAVACGGGIMSTYHSCTGC